MPKIKKVNWSEFLSKEHHINSLFKALNLNSFRIIEVGQINQIDENRSSVIVMAEDIKKNKMVKIIIDGKSGYPNWKQMIDVTFETGKDCDIRIVLYDECGEINDYYLDYYITRNFASLNNRFQKHTLMSKVEMISSDNEETQYDFIQDNFLSEVNSFRITEYPSKEVLQKLEFWIYLDENEGMSDPPLSISPENWFCRFDQEIPTGCIRKFLKRTERLIRS